MNLKQFMSATIPMFSIVGNHEWFDVMPYDFTSYLKRFSNPPVNGNRELYYSFNAGLAHWVMLAGYCHEMKTELTQPCLAKGSNQLNWLIADLAAVDRSSTPWVFVSFHEPYVNSNTAHSMETEGFPMQNAIEDILYEAKVDVVFSGHVHAYERSCQTYKYKPTDGAPYYITIGDGGNAEGLQTDWIVPQPEWSVYRQSSYGHGELKVVNSTHTWWQWRQNEDLDPLIADEFWFIKGDTRVNNPIAVPRRTGTAAFAKTAHAEMSARFNEAAIAARKSDSKI